MKRNGFAVHAYTFGLGILIATVALMWSSCSLDYTDAILSENMSEEIPDSILYDFTHTSVRNGTPASRLHADRAEIYEKKNETRLHDVVFQEFDRDGTIVTEGRADYTLFDTETEDAELSGDLSFYSSKEEATVSTDYLYWNDEEKTLVGAPEAAVTIYKDSGTELSGVGFEADISTLSVNFDGPVQGTYVDEDSGP